MIELDVPDLSRYEIGRFAAASAAEFEPDDAIAVRLVAAPVVARELHRLATQYELRAQKADEYDGDVLRTVARELRARVDELEAAWL